MNTVTFLITRENIYNRIYAASAYIVRAREAMGVPAGMGERMLITADDKRAFAPLMDDSVNEIFAEIAHYHPGSHVISTTDNDENGYRFAVRVPPNFPSANKDKLPHCIESYITDRTLQSWYTVIRPEEATVIATRTQNDAVILQTLLTQREKPARTV